MSNGEILETLERDINQFLQTKRLADDKRMMFRILQTFVIYLKDDHEKLQEMSPRVETLWNCRLQADKDNRENRRMILSPLISILITLGVSTFFNAIIFYFTYGKVLAMVQK